MTIDKDFLSNLSSIDEENEYTRTDFIQINFEQELKSLTVHHGDTAKFEAKISLSKSFDPKLLSIEWRLNDILIPNQNTTKYQFGSRLDENLFWLEIQNCSQQDEKVYTIHINYDNGKYHDESSAFLFIDQTTSNNSSENSQCLTSINHCIPPTISRLLQTSYHYHPGEQLHFLVEYLSSTSEYRCQWQVQYINTRDFQSVENAVIVHADCSSVLIIESIHPNLQGLYRFSVENIHGQAMTQTIVIVNTNDLDDDTNVNRDYHEIDDGQRSIQDISSNGESVYDERKSSISNEDSLYLSINDKGSSNESQHHFDYSTTKDLYGQRHIAYFDPAIKFNHVESFEQVESDDTHSNYQTQIGIPFDLPPPPPIDDTLDEHIYEDIPNLHTIPEHSHQSSVQDESKNLIDEPTQENSSSPNSLDEVLNHVEQWSDIIVDNETHSHVLPQEIYRISTLTPASNEYVDEEYVNQSSEHDSNNRTVEEIEKSVSTYLPNDLDHVIETIHIGDEFYEAKETHITGIRMPSEEFSASVQSDDDYSITSISIDSLSIEDHRNPSTDTVHKIEELLDLSSNHIVDFINIPCSNTSIDEQKPEAIIVTTEGNSLPSPLPPPQPTTTTTTTTSNEINDPLPIISLTIINEKSTGESLSVPIQSDLLPLATMPDQTANIDEQHRMVQDVLAASFEPMKNHNLESTIDHIPPVVSSTTDKVVDHEELFDVESNLIVPTEKPPITLAVAEKLQHDAAVEQEPIRPKFSLRLKPTITINNGDKLQLEVHFTGHPEPKVEFNLIFFAFNIDDFLGNMVFQIRYSRKFIKYSN